jgi:iron complex outermembrane receptor protein
VPGDRAGMSAVVSRGPYQEATALVEGQAPLSDRLGGSVCGAYSKDFTPDQAREAENVSAGVVLRWRPSEHTEIVPFWSDMAGGQHAVLPLVYADGVLPPPLFDARQLASQPFTSYGWRTTTFGVIARQSFGPQWVLTAGLFRAREQDRQSDVEEYLLQPPPAPERSVYHALDVLPPLSSSSISGEVRLVRHFGGEVHERKLDLSLRGRGADHAYGGDTLLCYGSASLDSGPPTVPPTSCGTLTANIDETRQLDAGAVYEERWKGVGSLGVGLLKSHYRRTIRSLSAAESSLATPWLPSLRFTLEAGRAVTLYGSYLQGLEDSALAPFTATLPGQPPPATRTRQVDGGLRYAPGNRVSVVLGGFEIQKVYFNLDQDRNYRALGTVRHRGVESSLAYGNGGLTVVAGGVWLKPHVERTVTEPGATGSVPIGPVPLTLTLNLDYAPARLRPFAGSVQVGRLSSRVATLDDHDTLPPLTTASAGLRYESRIRNHPFSVRFDAMNLTDARGLHLTSVGQVMPEFGRRFMLSIAIDH